MKSKNAKTKKPNGDLTKPGPVTQSRNRVVRENEILGSDRTEMIRSANDFVAHMVAKQILPSIGSGLTSSLGELTEEENTTYSSALSFLKRQFDQGYSHPEPFEKRVENEDSFDFAKPDTD